MGMAKLQFYRNKYVYPDFIEQLEPYGGVMDCTPRGVNLKTGSLRVKGNMTDFMSCNYLALNRDNQTIYAWIDDVEFHTEDSFIVTYTVDAWRTYRNKINLGVQYIERHPHSTLQRDPLLGSDQDYPDVSSQIVYSVTANTRIFVVQTRRLGAGDINSSTPVQPSPYHFYMVMYPVNNWKNSQPISELMDYLIDGAEPQNIVTMYSIPYMNISGLPNQSLPLETPSGTTSIPGWKFLGSHNSPNDLLHYEIPISLQENVDELLRVEHSVQLVIPDAGIINIPDELLKKDDLKLRQDIDLFSGASNYMLMSGEDEYYNLSVRGSSTASIPIVSDPMDTYISQNQNALATSLIGDVATIAGGAFMTGASGGAGGFIGGGAIASGVNSIINKVASIKDAGASYSNPPAFLGTALAGSFNNRFWIVVTKQPVDNANIVHANFGYPYNKVTNLVFPSSGYIKTEGCNVSSTDGSVPRWAIEEINQNFDNGILVRTS